jgi:hypothetical protein
MHRTGTTTDNQPVIAGAAQLTTTHGLPLELVLDHFRQRRIVVDWPDYIAYCLKDGHNPDTVRSRIEAAIAACFFSSSMYAGSWSFAILACCACTIFRTLSLSALEAMRDGETSSMA